jgi:hypothetical protein
MYCIGWYCVFYWFTNTRFFKTNVLYWLGNTIPIHYIALTNTQFLEALYCIGGPIPPIWLQYIIYWSVVGPPIHRIFFCVLYWDRQYTPKKIGVLPTQYNTNTQYQRYKPIWYTPLRATCIVMFTQMLEWCFVHSSSYLMYGSSLQVNWSTKCSTPFYRFLTSQARVPSFTLQ